MCVGWKLHRWKFGEISLGVGVDDFKNIPYVEGSFLISSLV